MIRTKNIGWAVLFFCSLFAGKAFSQGIDFKNISFEEALEQAKAEDKLIFIDFHTEWCGPCKKLAAGPFKEEANGDFYNQNFISLKLDAEKEGIAAAKRYSVTAYPTLIFVNGDGDIVHRGVGVKNGYDMIGFGREALDAATSKYSWEKLQEMYPTKQNDEAFLKLYYQKMDEFGVDPTEGMDAWLKVQTEFDESSEEMMEFLLSNSELVYMGSRAEEIFNANYDNYLAMSSEIQKKRLTRYRSGMFLRTEKRAQRLADPELMKVLIDRYQQYDLRAKSGDDLNTFKMDYYRFAKDYDAFKRLAEVYVDSLVALESIKEIQASDAAWYARYSKGKVAGEDAYLDYMLNLYKEGKTANDRVDAIVEVGHKYLDVMDGKKESKTLDKWISYCYELIPGKYSVDNLRADKLYGEGKSKEAIALKESAISRMPFTVKKKVNFEHELDLMKQAQK